MTSLKQLLLASIAITYGCLPALAETATAPASQRVSATALGQELKPSLTLFSPEGDLNSTEMPDLNLQVPTGQPVGTTTHPDAWESELLDEQRRADPGFLTITAD